MILCTREPWKNDTTDRFAVEAAMFLTAGLGDNDAILMPWTSAILNHVQEEKDGMDEDIRRANNSPKDRNGTDPDAITVTR